MGELIQRLPGTANVHWTPQRKAAVLLALRGGELSLFEAYQRYLLSADELREWEVDFDCDGIAGLRLCHTAKRAVR